MGIFLFIHLATVDYFACIIREVLCKGLERVGDNDK